MQSRYHRRDNRSTGLTLVEILVALTLMAVVLLPVVIGLSQSLVATSNASIAAVATSVAREKAEALKAETRAPGFDFALLTSQPRESADYKPGDGYFQVEVLVETIRPDDSNNAGLKKAAISVYRAGAEDPLMTLTTYLAPHGI
ncbi:MAG: type II secretion system protein, partial [Armatimonadetes bacterium]|nr:type II secretion system protein [Armatimonadota bacterium]